MAEAMEMEEKAVEKLMQDSDVLNKLKFFFTADGPTRVIITIENDAENAERGPKMVVHYREVHNLTDTAVYFMKNRRGKDNDDHVAIDSTKANDGTICFGIVRNPLESLEAVMRCVYRPMISDLGTDTWGQASDEQRQEFLLSIDSFSKGLQESIRSLTGGLELRKPDEKVVTLGNAAAGDIVLVTNSINLLQDWCKNIEHYLDDSDRNRWETPDSGPDTELEYWRTRMQRYVFLLSIFSSLLFLKLTDFNIICFRI